MVSSAGSEGKVSATSNSIMHISLDYPIKERADKNPFSEFNLMGFENNKRIGLNEILLSLEEAKTDDHIKGDIS